MAENPIDQNENSIKNTDGKEIIDEIKESNEEAPLSKETDLSDNQVPVDSGVTPQHEAHDDAADAGLPENFTKEPQDIEHMDLNKITESVNENETRFPIN